MSLVAKLLEITYEREVELEKMLEDTYRNHWGFTERTMHFNIDLQIACLKKLEQDRRAAEYRSQLH